MRKNDWIDKFGRTHNLMEAHSESFDLASFQAVLMDHLNRRAALAHPWSGLLILSRILGNDLPARSVHIKRRLQRDSHALRSSCFP